MLDTSSFRPAIHASTLLRSTLPFTLSLQTSHNTIQTLILLQILLQIQLLTLTLTQTPIHVQFTNFNIGMEQAAFASQDIRLLTLFVLQTMPIHILLQTQILMLILIQTQTQIQTQLQILTQIQIQIQQHHANLTGTLTMEDASATQDTFWPAANASQLDLTALPTHTIMD